MDFEEKKRGERGLELLGRRNVKVIKVSCLGLGGSASKLLGCRISECQGAIRIQKGFRRLGS